MLKDLLGIYFKANDGAGGGSGKDDADPKDDGKGADDGGGDKGSDGSGKGSEPAFTSEQQTHIDNIVKERLDRQKKTLRTDWEKEQKDAKDKADMGEVDRLKAEATETKRKHSEELTARDLRVLKAEAQVMAAGLGVKPERVGYAVKLADLSEVEFDDDGEPDANAVKVALEKVVKDLPELVGTSSGKGGSDFSGGSKATTLTREAIMKMSPDEIRERHDEIQAFYASNKGG